MKNILSSFVKEFIKVVIIVAVAVPTIALFAAWTGPTGAPPTNNADAPVNVGPFDQIKAYETDGLGNLISGKSGGLGVGTFFSRFTTLLAKDGGNVGIGQRDWLANPPTEKLDVDGFVKGQTGLCIGDDCRMAWPLTSETGIPLGYQEIYYNVGEDFYGPWHSGFGDETCDGNRATPYECRPEESRTCGDNDFGCAGSRGGGCSGNGHRTVVCKTSKILAQGEGLIKSTIGTATITERDYSGSNEWCRVKIQSPRCGWEGKSSESTEWNDNVCELWTEARMAKFCFGGKGLYTLWNLSGDSGPIEIFYLP